MAAPNLISAAVTHRVHGEAQAHIPSGSPLILYGPTGSGAIKEIATGHEVYVRTIVAALVGTPKTQVTLTLTNTTSSVSTIIALNRTVNGVGVNLLDRHGPLQLLDDSRLDIQGSVNLAADATSPYEEVDGA